MEEMMRLDVMKNDFADIYIELTFIIRNQYLLKFTN